MATLLGLKRSAGQTAKARGHRLRKWEDSGVSSCTFCANCGAFASVNTKPAPNDIDISGEAVALNCPHPTT